MLGFLQLLDHAFRHDSRLIEMKLGNQLLDERKPGVKTPCLEKPFLQIPENPARFEIIAGQEFAEFHQLFKEIRPGPDDPRGGGDATRNTAQGAAP